MKQKTCKVCRTSFTPRSMSQKACSPECAISLAVSSRGKAEKVAQAKDRRETKVKLERIKTRAQWAREAQASFNTWVRLRDSDLPCVSCGRHHDGQYHAGHYLSRGARPELAYEPLNCWKQCAPCNTHLSGNAVLYRKSLIGRIGLEQVEWLEGPHEPKKYTADDLRVIKAHYAQLVRGMKA